MDMKTGIALLLVGAMHARGQTRALNLESSLAQAITNTTYHQPSLATLTRAKELFRHTLARDLPCAELKVGWSELGLHLSEIQSGEESLLLLTEPAGMETGKGWYLFRQSGEPIALEAPHARNDVHTGLIAVRLFFAGKARVCACSTITRKRADMAHLEETFFQVLTQAFVQACPMGMIVQVHGFDTGNHGGVQTGIIASGGNRSPEAWLAAFVRQLRERTSLAVVAYPQETKQLGATRNAQSKAVRQSRCRFLHLELSMDVRELLMRDEELQRAFLGCIERAQGAKDKERTQ